MRISHIGQAIIPTPSKILHLHNVLHVPSVKKNLLSVPRFTHDNNVLVEFHPNNFLLRTFIQGPFFLEVDVVVVSTHLMLLMLRLPNNFLVPLKLRLHSGMLD
jgi:hypothetical protein